MDKTKLIKKTKHNTYHYFLKTDKKKEFPYEKN